MDRSEYIFYINKEVYKLVIESDDEKVFLLDIIRDDDYIVDKKSKIDKDYLIDKKINEKKYIGNDVCNNYNNELDIKNSALDIKNSALDIKNSAFLLDKVKIEGIFNDLVCNKVLNFLNGKIKEIDVCYELDCSEFMKKVLIELSKVKYGEIVSYKDIAEGIGNVKAVRAVGSALNKNPIMIVLPCHRVIGTNGDLKGFRSGIELKKFLINLEK